MTRTPQQGGIMRGGPFDGRIMAFHSPLMPALDKTGKRVGSYVWDDINECWEYEKDDGKTETIYP